PRSWAGSFRAGGAAHDEGFSMRKWIACAIAAFAAVRTANAQEHDHAKMLREMAAEKGWVLMQDGVVWATFNNQSGDRGGSEFVAPNWWMLMGMRKTPRGLFSVD